MKNKIVCAFSLDPDLIELAKAEAKAEKRSLSNYVELAIAKMLNA